MRSMDEPQDEGERIWQWRFSEAVKLGLGLDDAQVLAGSDVELAELRRLVERGCEPETAFEILR